MAKGQGSLGSVLVVEDEAMIRMMLTDMLEELGFEIAAESGDVDEAISLAQAVKFDFAILDLNVNGKAVLPLADQLEARKLPVIFVTGYGSDALPAQYRDHPYLQKPFQIEALASVISSLPEKSRL